MISDVNTEKGKLIAEIESSQMNPEEAEHFLWQKLKEYEEKQDIDKQIACHEVMFYKYRNAIYRTKLIELCLASGYRSNAEMVHQVMVERTAEEAKQMFGNKVEKSSTTNSGEKGCYVATCVYGSYDCPQVWTLRRFRDNTLALNPIGRIFIKIYYTLSPTAVKLFGDYNWFRTVIKKALDRLVNNLNKQGIKNTPYND